VPDEVLQLEARMRNFVSGELNKIEKDLKDVDRSAKRSFGSAQKSAGSFGQTLKGFVGAAAIIGTVRTGWRLLSNTVRESVQLYGVQVEAETKLQQALGYTSEALIKQASDLQELTLFGDEQTIQAQALIAMFVKEESHIKRIIPLVQDLAAAKGMQLNVAADLVSKTLGSSTNALARYGIQVEGAVGSNERLQNLVRGLSSAFEGQAQAVAQSGIGPLIQLENKIGDVKEAFGEALVPSLISLADSFKEHVLPVIEDVIRGFDEAINKTTQLKIAQTEAVLAEMREYRELREEQNAIITRHKKLKETGQWYDPAALEDARNAVALINEELKKLEGKTGFREPGEPPPTPPVVTPVEEEKAAKVTGIPTQEEMQIAAEIALIEMRIYNLKMQEEANKANQILLENNERANEEMLQALRDKEQQALEEAQAASERYVEIYQMRFQQVQASMTQFANTFGAISDLIIQITGETKEELKPLLYAEAIMRAATSTITAVQAAWETAGGNYYLGAALSAAAVIENAALLAGQIAEIASAARGANFIANQPQMLRVGDNPTQAEQVIVRPLGSPNAEDEINRKEPSVYNVTIQANNKEDVVQAFRELERDDRLHQLKRMLIEA
jgi:hypothetical protein